MWAKLMVADRTALKERLYAWWEGYELVDPNAEADADVFEEEAFEEIAALEPIVEHSVSEGWPADRVALNDMLWGEGFTTPGNGKIIAELIAPLGLTQEHSVIELGAGLGGLARFVSKKTGAWVSGYEEDPDLAEKAIELSNKAGMMKKAPIAHCEFPSLKVRKRTIDCVIAKESLFTVADKKRMFTKLQNMLKIEGHLLFTDFVAAEADFNGPATEVWAAHELRAPVLWSVEDIRAALEELEFEVRITEDFTDAYRERVVVGFRDLLRRMKEKPPSGNIISWAAAEAERWAQRAAVLESGEVKVFRIYARVPFPR